MNKEIRLVVPDEEFAWYERWLRKQPIRYHIPGDKGKHPVFSTYAMVSETEYKTQNKKRFRFLHLPGKKIEKTAMGFAKGSIKSYNNLFDRWEKLIRDYELV